MEVFSDRCYIITNQQNTRAHILFLLLLIAVLISPWLTVMSMGICARGILNERIGRRAFAITLISFLTLFNATKRAESDWGRYIEHYVQMTQVGYLDYLKGGGLSVRTSEPLYYAVAYHLSLLSDGNILVLVIAITLAIYFTYIYALERIMKPYGLHRWAAAICLLFALIVGITFAQSLHLVRQYIAGSILFLFFVFILERRIKATVILFVIGTLVHNSFIIPGSLLIVCAYLWNFYFVRRRLIGVMFILAGSGYVIGSQIASRVFDSTQAASALLDGGEVSSVVLLQDILFFFISVVGVVFFRRSSGFYTRASAISVLFLALFGGMVAGSYESPLIFLRFYFYVEWFRVIGIITVVWYLVYRVRMLGLAMLIIPLSFLGFSMRVSHSPWDYGGGVWDHLFQSLIWWVDNLSAVAQ